MGDKDAPATAAAEASIGAEPKIEAKKPKKKKVLLMGKSGSGKSSMRSIIFSNYLARDTRRLGATIDIDLSHVKFLGNLTLNLWDCGGQEAFMENYLSQQRQHVFSNVGVLIYVFDIESRDVDREMATYISIISALVQFSQGAKVFVLVHKMDLIHPDRREQTYDDRARLVRQKTSEYLANAGPSAPSAVDLTQFATSIWDQSLYKAWASIMHDLVPNLEVIERNLCHLGELIEAEELLLFERTSILCISMWSSEVGLLNPFDDRRERCSNILKSFKSKIAKYTGTSRNADQLATFHMKYRDIFSAIGIKFTTNTFILAILPPGEARFNSAMINLQIAAKRFETWDSPTATKDVGPATSSSSTAAAAVSSESTAAPAPAGGPPSSSVTPDVASLSIADPASSPAADPSPPSASPRQDTE